MQANASTISGKRRVNMGSSERRIPTARGMLQQMAAVAEREAGLISNRTKAALAAAEARGEKARRQSGRQTRASGAGGRAPNFSISDLAVVKIVGPTPRVQTIASEPLTGLCNFKSTVRREQFNFRQE